MKSKWLSFLFLLFFCGCATQRPSVPAPASQTLFQKHSLKEPVSASELEKTKPKREKTSSEGEQNPPSAEGRFISLQTGRQGSRILASPSKAVSSSKTYELSLDLEGANLLEFLDLIFGKTLQRSYAVSPRAQGKITVHIKGRFTEEALIQAVSEVLQLSNLALVRDGRLLRITPTGEMSHLAENGGFFIFKPRYLEASTLLPVVKQFVSRQAVVLADKASGVLVINDLAENIPKIKRLLAALDQNLLEGFYLELYRPQVLAAETLAEYLQKIFRSQVFKFSSLKNYVDFLALKELNALLILAREKQTLETVKHWILQLDTGESAEQQVFVYYVENGDAEEIAKILEEAFSEVQTESRRKTIIKAKSKKTTPSGRLSGKVRIIPDKTNNLLVISATPEDYRVILKLLRNIDIIPRQVLIEVIIAEISLNKNLEYGVEWWLKTNFNLDGRKYHGKIVSVNNYGGQAGKGFSVTVYRGLEPRALLAALDEVSEVHILSNPVILATDNKEAKIQIGEEVPTISQSVVNTSSQTPNITQNIRYRDVGIILGVKPHINSSGLVKLDVTQEISSVSDKVVQGVSSPVFTKRRIETSLVVQDGHTVILGGLIQNQHNSNESGVPLLKDVPVLGGLFKWHGTKKDRKELLVAITPRVVRSTEEAERVMEDYRLRIEELKERLSREFSGLQKEF